MKTKSILFLFALLFLRIVDAKISEYNKLDNPSAILDLQGKINTFGFQPNMGQIGSFDGQKVKDVLFYTRHSGIDLFMRRNGVSYVMRNHVVSGENDMVKEKFATRFLKEKELEEGTHKVIWARIDLDLVGGNIKEDMIEYSELMSGYTNYYFSHCPDGVLFVPSYKVVRIKEVYPEIDWIWRIGEDGFLHHEFEVKDGANVENIKLEFKWADVKLDENGKSLRLSTPVGDIIDGEIVAYDDVGKVELSYVIDKSKFVSFKVWNGYKGKLIIDPPLARLWATYYGGSDYDEGWSITTDNYGNIFVTGITNSINFPTFDPGGDAYFQGSNEGEYDIFILKFSVTGTRLGATYYGGSGEDRSFSITKDNNGNLFVTGFTLSTNFPTYNPGGEAYFQGTNAGGYKDAFILKLSNTCQRLWATYYGGFYDDFGYYVATDSNGNVFITGETASTNFPTYDPGSGAYFQGNNAGLGDIFILKFSNSGIRLWATYYGGSGNEIGFTGRASSIVIDNNGNVFITGKTWSTNFPTYNPGGGAYFQGVNAGVGYADAFILKFSNTGIRLWATYYGGNYADIGYSITTDANGNVFVTGETWSTNFPTYDPGGGAYFQGSKAGSNDIFILKFSNTGERLWATYYGGNINNTAWSITTDKYGNVFVTGLTFSVDFPTYNPGGDTYFQGIQAGGIDAFILKFSNTGERLWATYYGGNYHDVGYSITTDNNGNIFVTGTTESINFPTYDPGGGAYYQGSSTGTKKVFILKFEGEGMTEVGDAINDKSKVFVVHQNYPNPFNPSTTIKFSLQHSAFITLKVFDLLGNEISTLINKQMTAGEHSVLFDAKNLPSGVYFYQFKTNNFVQQRKMVVIR